MPFPRGTTTGQKNAVERVLDLIPRPPLPPTHTQEVMQYHIRCPRPLQNPKLVPVHRRVFCSSIVPRRDICPFVRPGRTPDGPGAFSTGRKPIPKWSQAPEMGLRGIQGAGRGHSYTPSPEIEVARQTRLQGRRYVYKRWVGHA